MSKTQLKETIAPFNASANIEVSTSLRSQTAIAAMVDAALVLDAHRTVVSANPASERLFGYNRSALVGMSAGRLLAGAGRLRAGRDHTTLGVRRDGERFPAALTLGEGERDGEAFFVCVVRDASARARADARWRRRLARLTAANGRAEAFARTAAHDLREPLRMVTAFGALLARDAGQGLDGRGREYLERMVAGAERMRGLLDDLIQFHGQEGGIQRGSWFEADDALDGTLEALGEAIRETGGRIERAPLPRIWGNPHRFARLLQNLIGNALKYVEPGTAPHVRISAAREGGAWRIAIADNGIGVEPRHQARIFEPFQRLQSVGRYPGAGLGLAICRDIVAGFGGRLRVRAAPGGGSIFSFTVKIREDKDNDGATR